ncbi:MAG: ATP-binding cassette domain-containing protein [Acidimicrobiia bacterium]|nr:ATP-binding cassette domain-containing protein [Acidimicrobiia bacterium]
MSSPLLLVDDLEVHFRSRSLRRQRIVRAVNRIGFRIESGETLALVGESGCGKSTTVRAVMRLLEPTGGRVLFQGTDITHLDRRAMRPIRRHMQVVFQDPYGSLNPRMTARQIIAQPLRIHGEYGDSGPERVTELLGVVGLSREHADRFPHEFSGGQRQRVGIARALALSPRLVVLDEPVSSLDVSIRAQILNLLRDLQDRLGVAFLLVSHDLSVVRHLSDRVAVMYLGRIVETAPRRDIFDRPHHPYTRALLSAVPSPDPTLRSSRIVLKGEVPDPAHPPAGCGFWPRCFQAEDRCRTEDPGLSMAPDEGHFCACHFPMVSPSLDPTTTSTGFR